LLSRPWDPKEAAKAIDEIVADALGHFDRERFWPSHARDDGLKDGHSSKLTSSVVNSRTTIHGARA